MMYPERMERVTIVTPIEHVKRVVELLYEQKALHIIDHTKNQMDIGSPLSSSAALADLLIKTRSLIHGLDIAKTTARHDLTGDLGQQVTSIHEHATALMQQQRDAEQALHDKTIEVAAYEELRWLHIDPVKLRDSQHLIYFFGTIKDAKQLNHALATITPRHYLELQTDGAGIFVLIDKEKANACRELLNQRGFVAADHNRIVSLTKPLEEQVHELHHDIIQAKRDLNSFKKALHELSREHAGFLVSTEAFLSVEAKKAQTPLRFGVTKYACFINGWVPQQNIILLTNAVEQELGNEIFVQRTHTHEEAPVKLDNAIVVSPFETIIKLYTLPKYSEIDPSTLLFLSFPLFFGFMLGDIGYGILLLVLAFLIRSKAKGEMTRSIGGILIMSSVATVVFGCVFGEFFGAEKLGGFHIPYLIHRAEDMTTLLGVAVAVGVIHITLALIVGFINEQRHKGFVHAFCAKISWILLLIATSLIAAGYAFNEPLVVPGSVLGVASIVLIYIGEGAKGLVEIPGIFSNILSYARLMALGVASAALAVVVNEMAGALFRSGTIMSVIGGVLILLLGHAVNFSLGIIGPFLHSLRLHYVEFFSKFYEGGGKPYKPFGAEES